jgi:hypothetical protein
MSQVKQAGAKRSKWNGAYKGQGDAQFRPRWFGWQESRQEYALTQGK